jgi:hypothetical protein
MYQRTVNRAFGQMRTDMRKRLAGTGIAVFANAMTCKAPRLCDGPAAFLEFTQLSAARASHGRWRRDFKFKRAIDYRRSSRGAAR